MQPELDVCDIPSSLIFLQSMTNMYLSKLVKLALNFNKQSVFIKFYYKMPDFYRSGMVVEPTPLINDTVGHEQFRVFCPFIQRSLVKSSST